MGATCHNFRIDIFEKLKKNLDGVINFEYGPSIKPMGIGIPEI